MNDQPPLTDSDPEELRSTLSFLRQFRPVFAREHGAARRRSTANDSAPGTFERWCRHFLPEHFTLEPSRMHRWMFRYLDTFALRRGEKLNVLAPRGGAKSTIGTLAYPLKMAVEGTERYIWLVSDTHDQAATHLNNLHRAALDSPELRDAYPQAVGRGMRSREGVLLFANGVRIEAYGTGQKVRGRRHGALRPTLIVCDDLQNDAHSRSARMRFQSREWFFGALLKAGDSRTNVVHLATALHRDALGLELTRTPGWKSRLFRALVQFPTNMDLWQEWESIYNGLSTCPGPENALSPSESARRFYLRHRADMNAGAVVLWEAEENLYTLMKMRAEAGHSAFEREKQNSPINPDLCEWEEGYFDRPGFWVNAFPELKLCVVALDPSKGKHANHGDYSAYVVLGLGVDGEMYVDAKLLRVPIDQLVEEGVRLWNHHRPDLFGVEGNQFQDLLADFFAEKFRSHGFPALQPCLIHNHVAKQVRLRRLGPYLAAGKLHFRADSPSVQMLVEQLRQFPIGDHDDGPDALEMALRLLLGLLQSEEFDDGLGSRLLPETRTPV